MAFDGSVLPVQQFKDESVGVVKLIPQERIPKRAVEKMVDVPVPQIQEQTDEEVLRQVPVPVMRPVDVPVRIPAVQTVERRTFELPKIVYEVVKLVSQGQVQNCTVEQIVVAFVPQIQDELVEVIRCLPRERVPVRQTDDVSMQIQEGDSDMFTDLDEQLVYEVAGSERPLHGVNGYSFGVRDYTTRGMLCEAVAEQTQSRSPVEVLQAQGHDVLFVDARREALLNQFESRTGNDGEEPRSPRGLQVQVPAVQVVQRTVVEVTKVIPQERLQQHTGEDIGDPAYSARTNF